MRKLIGLVLVLGLAGSAAGQTVQLQRAASVNPVVLQAAAVADGNGTPMPVQGFSYVVLDAAVTSGDGTANLNFDGSFDNSTYYNNTVACTEDYDQSGLLGWRAAQIPSVAAITADAMFKTRDYPQASHRLICSTGIYNWIRVRLAGMGVATITVTGYAAPIPNPPMVMVAQGPSNQQGNANAWAMDLRAVNGALFSSANPLFVVGTKTNNGAAPSTNNVGSLGMIANAAQQTWTEGRQVLGSTDLRGRQRTLICDAALNDRCGNVTAGNAQVVDGSAVTQPVSAAALPLPSGAATAALQGATDADDASIATGQTVALSGALTMAYDGSVWRRLTFGTAGTASAQVLSVQGIASMTPFLVTLGAETAKVIGTTRVIGNAGAAFDAATGAAPPANVVYVGGLTSGATGGFLTGVNVADTFYNVNISTATTTLVVTGVSGRHVRIASINLVTAAANNVGVISGTGATCGTGSAAIVGTTAATGWNLAANGGLTLGNGIGTVLRSVATGDSVCLITSASTQLSGAISYAIW